MSIEIYSLSDPDSGEIRYIGKANNARLRLNSHVRDMRRKDTPLYCWMRKLAAAGKHPVVTVVEVVDDADWQHAEVRQIAAHRLTCPRLLNLADGGNEPFCPPHIRAENGKRTARAVHGDARRKRFWQLKRALGVALKQGYVREPTRERLRQAAIRHPKLFGEWAAIPKCPMVPDERNLQSHQRTGCDAGR